MSPTRPGLSIFFPCYNDAGTIASMVMEALVVCRELAAGSDEQPGGGIRDYEVLVVENGSSDYAPDILDELERLYGEAGADPWDAGRVRILRYDRPLDYGGALRAGFRAARFELVFYTDGDAQYDIRELRKLWPELRDGVDVVMGNKLSRQDPLHRIVVGRLYHLLMAWLFRVRLHDIDCDFRLLRRGVFDFAGGRVTLTQTSGTIALEMMKKMQDRGYRTVEVPVHHYHRAYGVSQFFNFRRLFRVVVSLARLWWWLVVRGESGTALPLPEPQPRAERTGHPSRNGPPAQARQLVAAGGRALQAVDAAKAH